ncbi:hypothetical protein E6W39_21975 [Kitasatospora acidiphila]|uniref:Uncharacterized protein n=1 Tax=Kitasatospora acidiphila TaxID=2567942 RepID=A0A540W5V6_9ACTN|nr:hypothetical protein [Kitasatospora acidiphila]TQF04402.1 hypothetical protein E6W39_21975 [Kitasatospora acidiphila]
MADWEDLLGDLLADRVQALTADLLSRATDDASMGRILRRSIRNWLIDRARQTGLGALRRRLEAVLSSEPNFEQVPEGESGAKRWRLTGSGWAPWSGATDELISAAHAVQAVKVPKWSSTARRAPIADKASLVAVAAAVLSAAGGSMEIAQLVAVFAARFPTVLDPVIVTTGDDFEGVHRDEALSPEEVVVAAEEELHNAVTAAEIVGMLSPEERLLLPIADQQARVQELLGCGRSQASLKVKRLREKLKQLLGEQDVHGVGLEVIRLCADTHDVE